MVETRRTSSSSKRPLSSPRPMSTRSKLLLRRPSSSRDLELRSTDLLCLGSPKSATLNLTKLGFTLTLKGTVVSDLSKYKIMKSGTGRSHTVVFTEDGQSFAFGWNKHGQLGSGSLKNETGDSLVRCLVSEVHTAAC